MLHAGITPRTYVRRDGTIVAINDIGLRNMGVTREQVIGVSVFSLFPSMASAIRERVERVFDTSESLEVEDDEVVLPSGSQAFRSILSPVLDDAGRVVAVQIESRDVTAEYAATADLRRANDKLSLIFTHSPYLILLLGRNGVINYINRAGPGFKVEDVIGSDSHYAVHSDFHPSYDAALRRCFEDRQPAKFEFRDVHGSWWLATMVPVEDGPTITQVISFSVDVTEKRKAEEEQARLQLQMQDKQKLESLGVLAGGIAHDFNNLLVVITSNTELALRAGPANRTMRTHLEDVVTAARRAADLCRQMLAYAGRGRFVVDRIDLSKLVAEMTQLVEVSISKGVEVRRNLHDGLPPIEADATQLRQVVLNLLTNASDAIGSEGGSITIATTVEDLDQAQLRRDYLSETLPPQKYVMLEVRDSGRGIDDATRARMFDPFFSTKASGRGLGLSATLGILRAHHGGISVESTLGVGTTIRAIFPAVEGEATQPALRTGSSASGRGLVLVVDDERGVREAARQVLAGAGYEVLTANDGHDAITLYEEHSARIRLVLLDLTMPKLSGAQTLRALRDRDARLPVIVMSGYSDATLQAPGTGFLAKPFLMEELLTAIAVALEDPS